MLLLRKKYQLFFYFIKILIISSIFEILVNLKISIILWVYVGEITVNHSHKRVNNVVIGKESSWEFVSQIRSSSEEAIQVELPSKNG